MPDREKVIEALKIHLSADDLVGCVDCTYSGDEWCLTRMLTDVLSLLKEQEPVEPNVSSTEQRCGNCNKVIEMDGWIACPWCGKPIAWNEWWNKNGERR